jgi:chemotaxis protein methyltransferase CheR
LTQAQSPVIERLETDLLMEALARAYGLDVRRYARSTFEVWAADVAKTAGAENVSALTERMLHDRDFGARAIDSLLHSDVQLFDNADYWRVLRDAAMPWLRTSPFLSIWMPEFGHAGSVYSLAILLEEAGLYDRARIYATDRDAARVTRGAEGLASVSALQAARASYIAAGGIRQLDDYFPVDAPHRRLVTRLRSNIVWSQFDPDEGESFNEFHLIDARRIHVGQSARALKLLAGSLPVSGLLALAGDAGANLRHFNRSYKDWGNGLCQRVA